MGILSGMNGIWLAVALPLGSFISNQYGWRATYHIAIPFVIALAIITYAMVKESPFRRPNVKIDYVGAILLGLPLALTVLALGEGANWGWTSAGTISFAAIGIGLLFPLFLYEQNYLRRGGEPILNLRLLGIRNVAVTNFVILGLLGMTLAQQVYVFKLELPSPVGYGLDIFEAGLSLVPLALAMVIFAPLTGLVVSKVGVKPMGILGSTVAVIGFLFAAQTTTYAGLLASAFVLGTGLAILMASVQNLLVLTVNPRDMGLATALNSVFRNLGNSMGAPIAGAVLSTFTVSVLVGQTGAGTTIYKTFPATVAFQYSFYIGAAVFVVIALVFLTSREVLGKKSQIERGESGVPHV